MVYILVSGQRMKIGKSTQPNERFKQLGVIPEENTLIIHTTFDFELEVWLHQNLKHANLSGEWFDVSAYGEVKHLLDLYKDRFGIKRVAVFKTHETAKTSQSVIVFGMNVGYSEGLYNLTDATKHFKACCKLPHNYKPEKFLKSDGFLRLDSIRKQQIKTRRGVTGGIFVPLECLKLFVLTFDDSLFLTNLGVSND